MREMGNNALATVLVPRPFETADLDGHYTQGTGRFNTNSILYISIERVNSPIARIVKGEPIVLGREETTLLGKEDINLSPYNALERGVSRRHARIYANKGQLYIEDLGSSNGTTLNGEELEAHKAYRVSDGDEIMLGRMMLWINF